MNVLDYLPADKAHGKSMMPQFQVRFENSISPQKAKKLDLIVAAVMAKIQEVDQDSDHYPCWG